MQNKDGSYVIKEIYRNFDRELLAPISREFMVKFQENITDKYSICIFKEIVQDTSREKANLDELLDKYLSLFATLKLDTFYHFGLQYFIEVKTCYSDIPCERLYICKAV